MCSVFSPTQKVDWVREHFGVPMAGGYPEVAFPGYLAPIVVKSQESGRVACGLARFGLVPSWAKDATIGRRTYNARSIWDRWTDPATGEVVASFSMLTINAEHHPIMNRFHKPGDEKRTPVVLAPDQFGAWLDAMPDAAMVILHSGRMPELTSTPA